jgi:hypothetical protein
MIHHASVVPLTAAAHDPAALVPGTNRPAHTAASRAHDAQRADDRKRFAATPP